MRNTGLLALAGLLLLASTVQARGPQAKGGVRGDTRIEGVITTIDAELLQFGVNDVLVQVTDDTIIKMRGQAITFNDLALGQTVAACGIMDGGVLVASRVTVRFGGLILLGPAAVIGNVLPLPAGTRVVGVITAIDADLLQLVIDEEVVVQITDETILRMWGQAITFEVLEVGQTVAACGIMEDDVLLANRVTVRMSEDATRIEGLITAIDADLLQIVVNDVVVQVTDNTVIKTRGLVITFDDLAVDQYVAACGIMEEDFLVAAHVTVQPCGE